MLPVLAPPSVSTSAQRRPAASPLPPSLLGHPAASFWLWIVPIAVLLLLNVQGYWVVSDNLDASQRGLAHGFGLAALANALIGALVGRVARRRQRAGRRPSDAGDADVIAAGLPWWAGLPAIATQVAYLTMTVAFVGDLLPRSVTAWIYPEDRFVFNQFAFAMVPLFWGIVQVACALRFRSRSTAIGTSLAMVIGAPLALYFGVLAALGSANGGALAGVILATLFVAGGLLMFIGVVRGLVSLLAAVQRRPALQPIAVVVLGLVLPGAGLLLNRVIPFPVDFQAWEVYALLVVNAAALFLGAARRSVAPMASFGLLCATLPFSLYFFVVLLPYTPLAVLAVIAFGLGFLVLTPTLLFGLHVYLLRETQRELARRGLARRGWVVGALCAAVLPAAFNLRAVADKAALNAALAYVATPSVETTASHYPGDVGNLRRALASHRHYKNGIYYPYLSDLYSWIVFDNLVLPDRTLAQLEEIFVGASGDDAVRDPIRMRPGWFGRGDVREGLRMPRAAPLPDTVEVEELHVRSEALGGSGVLTAAFTLRNVGDLPAEFTTLIPLPSGIVVSGFRMEVAGTMVPGRIFEKKTAQWVYAMIRDSERRDPGLLFYASPHQLQLQVFPVSPTQPTRVEIDFLLPQAIEVAAAPVADKDFTALLMWAADVGAPRHVTAGASRFVTGQRLADRLPAVERTPYLHLLVDRSEANGWRGGLDGAITSLRRNFPDAKFVRVTLANFDVVDERAALGELDRLADLTSATLDASLPRAGGLALDLAAAHALREHRDLDLDGRDAGLPLRPVLVLLSHRAPEARSLELDVAEAWAATTGGLELYELDEEQTLVTHRVPAVTAHAVLRWGKSVRPLFPDGATVFAAGSEQEALEFWQPEAAAWQPVRGVEGAVADSPWARAMALQLEHARYAENPGRAAVDLSALVAASRASGVLLPATSYMVVENAAQWKMLAVSERQKLRQNSALDFREAPAPSAWLLGGAFGAVALVRRWRRRRG